MRLHLTCFTVAALGATSLTGQHASFTNYGSGCAGTGTGFGQSHVVPAANATQFGSTWMGPFWLGIPSSAHRDQYLYPASDLPSAFTMSAIGTRFGPTLGSNLLDHGGWIDMELTIGYTTNTAANLSGTWASNWNAGTPVTVVPRSLVRHPDIEGWPQSNDPNVWQFVIPFTTTFAWTPQPGRNLLVELKIYGASGFTAYGSYAYDTANGNNSLGWSSGTLTGSTAQSTGAGTAPIFNFYSAANHAPPKLGNHGLQLLGQPVDVDLAQANPASFAFLMLGWSNTAIGSSQLPLDLTSMGAPGCQLLTSAESLVLTPTDNLGLAWVNFTIPNLPGLVGMQYFGQFACLDPTVNGLGHAFSDGGVGTIGTWQ